jgi:hypothetical protein
MVAKEGQGTVTLSAGQKHVLDRALATVAAAPLGPFAPYEEILRVLVGRDEPPTPNNLGDLMGPRPRKVRRGFRLTNGKELEFAASFRSVDPSRDVLGLDSDLLLGSCAPWPQAQQTNH